MGNQATTADVPVSLKTVSGWRGGSRAHQAIITIDEPGRPLLALITMDHRGIITRQLNGQPAASLSEASPLCRLVEGFVQQHRVLLQEIASSAHIGRHQRAQADTHAWGGINFMLSSLASEI